MRVIAGTLGGRRLQSPPGRTTRPTSERVREALFAMLGPLDGDSVLDLFAGTGALGIEALSRGAGSALFVERDAGALRALEANLEALALAPPQARVRRGEALSALREARRAQEKYDLILIDPPYARAQRWEAELASEIGDLLAAGARVVVESDRRAPLSLPVPLTRHRRYGDTAITIHTAP